MKFALISNLLPPSHSAHAAIIARLLRDRDPSTYVLLSAKDYRGGAQDEYSERLPATYYRLGRRWSGMPGRVAQVAAILRRERCEAVVACTGGDEVADFAAGYLASRLTRMQFYAYLLDQFSHMLAFGVGRSPLRRLEPRIMRDAAGVIVQSEHLAAEIRSGFGIDPVVIHNPCDLALYDRAPSRDARDGRSIVYTGQVGVLHFAALRNLLAAIESLGGEQVCLDLYTNQSADMLEGPGIRGPVRVHAWRPLREMPAVQMQADVLYLPLSIGSAHPGIVRTAAPGKMGEYLAARRPILVHAPADSFLAWYFRTYECGLVVDRDDPAELADALLRLLTDAELAARLSERARQRAEADFSLPEARARFEALLPA